MKDIQLTTDDMLREMANIFRERNTKYGSNYNKVAAMMTALFPNGITLQTHEDFIRFHFLDWTVGKLTRFVNTNMTDVDSAKDGGVYLAMLADLTIKLQKKEEPDER